MKIYFISNDILKLYSIKLCLNLSLSLIPIIHLFSHSYEKPLNLDACAVAVLNFMSS